MLAQTASTFAHDQVDFANIFGGTGQFSNSHSFEGQTLDNILRGMAAR